MQMDESDNLIGDKALEPMANTPIGTAQGIAAIALNMAMKYHDINIVKDGALYQQYKIEGRNMTPLHLDMVFETAIKIEMHLLGSEQRIAKMVVDAITFKLEEDEQDAEDAEAALADFEENGCTPIEDIKNELDGPRGQSAGEPPSGAAVDT